MASKLAVWPLVLGALLRPVHSRQGPLPDLQPYQCNSTDGRWVLSINPSQRDGGGPADYRCTHDGKEAWAGQKPWTLQQAVVTDDGHVAGYSYSEGGLSQFAGGELHVVILAPDGTARLDEEHKRASSNFMHEPPNPRCDGVFHHPDRKSVVFRIADADINRRREEWWWYGLPDAKQTLKKRPRDELPEKDPSDMVIAARGVAGTALTLVEWRTFDWPKIGLQFSLVDPELKPVWQLPLPEELVLEDEDAADRLRYAVYESGTILKEEAQGRFAIGLPKSGERISYAVEGVGSEPKVRELAREPWSLPGESRGAGKFEDLPPTRLVHQGSHVLEAGLPSASPLHDIVAFDVLKPDRFRVVCEEARGKAFTLLQVDLAGAVLSQQRIELTETVPESRLGFWTLGARRWLVTESPYGVGTHAKLRMIDEESGSITPIDILDCPPIEDVAALDDDRFVVLATEHGEFTASEVVRAYHRDGRLLWRLDQDYNSREPSSLFSPDALAVTTEGKVAIIDVIRHSVQVFGSDGRYLSIVDLAEAWSTKPNYPSGVRADIKGGVIVHDFNGEPPLYRMDIDGTVRSKLSPRFPDDRTVDGLTRHVRVAPDGKLWATDGQRLLRMDDRGVVDHQIGVEADVDVLAEPSATTIDVFGRALVQDKATGAVHVFDGKGKRLFVCRPEPTDFTDPRPTAHLAATRERGVIAAADREELIRFGPDGARQGKMSVPDRRRALVFSPIGEGIYAGRFNEGFVALGADLRPQATFDRAPDGSWLQGADEPAVAPDGAVAVISGGKGRGFEGGTSLVIFEKSDPKLGRSIDLPDDTPSYCLALGRKWAAASKYGNTALLIHRVDGRKLRFVVPDVEEGSSCRFGFDPENDDLLVIDAGARKLHRFAMP